LSSKPIFYPLSQILKPAPDQRQLRQLREPRWRVCLTSCLRRTGLRGWRNRGDATQLIVEPLGLLPSIIPFSRKLLVSSIVLALLLRLLRGAGSFQRRNISGAKTLLLLSQRCNLLQSRLLPCKIS